MKTTFTKREWRAFIRKAFPRITDRRFEQLWAGRPSA